MSRKLFFCICLLLLIQSNCEASPAVVVSIGAFLLEAIGHINSVIDFYKRFITESVFKEKDIDLSLIELNYYEILKKLGKLPKETTVDSKHEKIQDIMDYIEKFFEDANDTISFESYDDKERVLKNCEHVLDENKGIIAKMNKIRLRFQKERGAEFLKNVIEQRSCSGVSDQQYAIAVLQKYLKIELKTSALIRFAYYSKQIIQNKNHSNDLEKDLNKQLKDMKEITTNFRHVILKASRMQQSCDLGSDDIKDFPREYYGPPTDRTVYRCPEKNIEPEVPGCYNRKKYPCVLKQKQCNKIIDCEAKGQMKICFANNYIPKRFTRRYIYVSAGNSPPRSCKDNLGKNVEVSVRDTCDCICQVNNGVTTRGSFKSHFFNLVSIDSLTDYDSVITGVGLNRKLPFLLWEISEGGLIDKTVNTTDRDIWKTSIPLKENYVHDEIKKTAVYELNWFNKRGIFLDFHELDHNHVLTGIKFGTEEIGNEIAIRLEVRQTELDHNTWKLKKGTSKWKYKTHTLENIRWVDVELEAPTKSGKPHSTNEFEPDRFLRFSPSNLESNDAGQTVLPYFDLQAVYAGERICGLGIDLSTAPGSGGYIKPIVKHCDILIKED